jgi:site-specific DNA recombinase
MEKLIDKMMDLQKDELDYSDSNTSLYCYLRVSTQTQVDDGNSIENQRFLGQKIATKLGFTYVEMNEGGLSSVSSSRPVFDSLRDGIRNRSIKNIWYYSRSRWTRTTIEDLLMKKNYFKKYNTNVYEGENGSVRNFNDAKDEMLDTILTSVQQFDREQRREVSVSGKRHLSRQNGESGVFMGGTINFGYANVDKKWTVNKDEAKYVKTIFTMYSQGKSLKELKSYLDLKGISPRRSSVWNLGTLHTMLKNRVYLGEYKWTDKESNEKFDIRFDAIISHSLFNRVQKKLDKNTRNKGSNLRQYSSLLSDFLVCSCGERILGNVRQKQNRKIYFCSSRNNKWKGKDVSECRNRRSMNMDMTDDFVLNQVKEVMSNSSILKEKFKQDVLSKKNVDSKQIELEKEFLEKRIKRIDTQIDLTIKSISTNEVNSMLRKMKNKIYEQIKSTLNEELASLEDKKSVIVKEIDDLDSKKEWVDWITKYGNDISKKFDNVTTELLEGMISSIKVTPTFDKNRDSVETQIGHKLVVNFKQAIVGDNIVYEDEKNKSKGYNVVNGKAKLNVGNLEILKGGRGKTSKKKAKGIETGSYNSNQSL